jgi:hypothetical protein
MKKTSLILACGLLMVGGALWADPEITSSVKVTNVDTAAYPGLAKVGMEKAVEIARQASHGNKAISANLTANWHADGSAYLIWDCDTVSKKVGDVTAVFIDPVTGKVLGTQAEDWAMADAKDKKDQKEEKKDEKDAEEKKDSEE